MFFKETVKNWVFEETFDPPRFTPMLSPLSLGESNPISNPLPSQISQSRYGGIALNKKAELKISHSNITGAVFEPLTGQLILVGQKRVFLPEMPVDDLAVAFKSVYGLGGISPCDPAVSIEPSADQTKMTVSYFGQIFGTQFGLKLFEADYTLKRLVVGTLQSQTPGYISLTKRFTNNYVTQPGSYRTWIVPETIELVESEDRDSMVFSKVKMKCLNETHSTADRNHISHQQFAEHFTAYYDSFASEYPIFQEIKRLAQITGVVKWLRENNVPIDLSYFTSYSPIPCNTPLFVDSLKTESGWWHQNMWGVVNFQGGINLQISLSKTTEEGANQNKENILSSKPYDSCLKWDLPNGDVAETCAVAKTKKAGNLHLEFTDFFYPLLNDSSFSFSRSYDSFNDRDFGMGIGWTFTPAFLEIPEERIVISELQKKAAPFILLKTKERDQIFTLKKYKSDGSLIYLPENEKGFLVLQPSNIWSFGSDTNSMLFDARGNITLFWNSEGTHIIYKYEDENLCSISCLDKTISLFYKEGRLVEVMGLDGKSIFYRYNHQGELEKAGEEMAYGYDENHRLCRFSNPEDFLIFQGSYDDFNRLKTEKWGPIESVNEYFLKDQKIRRTISIDYDMLSAILKKKERYGN